MLKLLGHLKTITFYTILVFVLLASNQNIPKLDYNNIKKGRTSINLCEIHEASWDSIILVAPYSREALWKDIKNINSIAEELSQMQSVDWKNYLIFLEGQTAVGYMEIPRDYVDFDHENEGVRIVIYKANCILYYKKGKLFIPSN
jgi:hypothetical protein